MHLRAKLKYWFRNNQWLRSQALIETLINDPGTETGQQCLHVNTKVSTRAVSSNSNSIFYQGHGCPIMGHNQVWWVIHMVFVHFTCITYWLQHGFESILVSIFDHLIDITFRIVYQQAHCHWSSLFALRSLDSLVEVIHDSLLSYSLHFVYHCLMIFDTLFLNFFHCWLISWLVNAHCLSLIYSCHVFINKLTLCAVLAYIALVLTDRTHQLLAWLACQPFPTPMHCLYHMHMCLHQTSFLCTCMGILLHSLSNYWISHAWLFLVNAMR